MAQFRTARVAGVYSEPGRCKAGNAEIGIERGVTHEEAHAGIAGRVGRIGGLEDLHAIEVNGDDVA